MTAGMSSEKQGLLLPKPIAATKERTAACSFTVDEMLRKERTRKLLLNIRIALIDEFPFRRGSTLNLLRLHVSKATSGFSSVDELFSHAPARTAAVKCTIFSTGARSITETPMADALHRLGRLGAPKARRPLIVLSDREELEEVVASFRAGAQGFIPTSLSTALVVTAIRFILAGGTFVPAKLLLRVGRGTLCENKLLPPPKELLSLPKELPPSPKEIAAQDSLQWPPRQLAVLHLLGEGKTNGDIAEALGMEKNTVKAHVRHIMRKLNVTNRTQVALHVRRIGLADPLIGGPPGITAEGDIEGTLTAA